MNNIEKEFVPYEEALALEKLGFDEWCFSFYNNGQLYNSEGYYKKGDNVFPKTEVVAPTFSQAFRFFREKYKLQTYIDFYHSNSYFYKIKSQDGRNIGNTGYSILQGIPLFTKPYEDAELACLKRLIKIIKEKENG